MAERLKGGTPHKRENIQIEIGECKIPQAKPKILVADDDPATQALISRIISRQGYSCDVAGSLERTRSLLGRMSYDIIFLDLSFADGSALQLLENHKDLKVRTLIVIITGMQCFDTAIEVIRNGAYDYITKPFNLEIFEERLEKVVDEWRSRIRYRYYQTHLEEMVNIMTRELRSTSQKIEHVYDATVAALGAALDLRDPETEDHCWRVAENSAHLGKALGLSGLELRNLKWGSYLHDIGKIGIPEHILMKNSGLTPEEMEIVKAHPFMGFNMISNIEFLKDATDVVLYHHEKYDGSGYPYGLTGSEIPRPARIFAVVDALDAMIFDRPYRRALLFPAFVEELRCQSGKHFDPHIVNRFLKIPEKSWRAEKDVKKAMTTKGIIDTSETIKLARR